MDEGNGCSKRQYTRGEVFLDNLPYATMLALGAAIVWLALPPGAARWEWVAAAGYVAYGLMGSAWIILFVCPFCPSYGGGMCPCGYGGVAARLRRRGDPALFTRKFKRNIPVLFPLWLVPPGLAGWGLSRGFSWDLTGILAGFCVVAFVVLPLYARHGCERCPQRGECPWMKAGDGDAGEDSSAPVAPPSRPAVTVEGPAGSPQGQRTVPVEQEVSRHGRG